MKFKDFKYERPSLENAKAECGKYIDIIMNSDDFDKVCDAIISFNKERAYINSMGCICNVRHTIDTNDEFYNKEIEWFDENGAFFQELENNFLKSLVETKHSKKLEEKFGSHLFKMIKVSLESFSPEIIEELQEESQLVTRYGKLTASAKIEFDGKILNTSQMGPYVTSKDRDVRRKAEEKIWEFFESHSEEYDEIYDKLVKVRDRMAKKLGFKNYVELGYKRLGRTDYDANDVKKYRDQVYNDLVPIVSEIYKKQQERIGIEDFKSYDIPLSFNSGNAVPLGDLDYKLSCARKMYHELSDETFEFVDFMLDNELIDLLAKPGKETGGYCTSISLYKSPFVFANFNGTSADVDVLTHEFGHAFQYYCCKDTIIPEYEWPTLESCEIHSMSMEFFAWPWMELFFGDDVDKYRYSHLTDSITFIPYGVLIDEYQHWVYENPNCTPKERKEMFRVLEKKYMPWKVYDNKFLEEGSYWIRQSHIYQTAFYYIDYTLAQNCAHQFWCKNMENHKNAWKDYLNLCKAGGSKSFTDLLKVANLKNPFEDGTVKYVVSKLKKWLDEFDSSKLK